MHRPTNENQVGLTYFIGQNPL